jgi:hypothetical protein
VKLPEQPRFDEALALDGADRWSPMPNGKGMGWWVMLPEELHDDLEGLTPWVERAHRLAMMAPLKRQPARPGARASQKQARPRAKATPKSSSRSATSRPARKRPARRR